MATAELTSTSLGVAHRAPRRLVGPELSQRLEAATATFASAIHDATPGRIDHLDDELATYLTALRDAAHDAARSAIDTVTERPARRPSARAEAVAALTEIADTASRDPGLVRARPIPDRTDVVWLEHEDGRPSRRGSIGGTGGASCCGWRRCRWPGCCGPGCSRGRRRC